MNKADSDKLFVSLCENVALTINKVEQKSRSRSTINKMFLSALALEDVESTIKQVSIKEQAINGNKDAREHVKEEIYRIIVNLNLPVIKIDRLIENYDINYYGQPTDLYTGGHPKILSKLAKILIRRDASIEEKYRKLSQMVYQDLYGLSIVDELCNQDIDRTDMSKIEEVAAFGGECVWMQVSGIKQKLDGMVMKGPKLKGVVNRLVRNSTENLNKSNPEVETQRLCGDRVTCTCPPYATPMSFNIRLHYENAITGNARLKQGSTSAQVERFLDLIVPFSPNLLIVGGQGTGKSTFTRDLYRRYPAGTVIGTIESSYELALSKYPHLIVQQLQIAANRDYAKAMEDMLRFGLDLMVIGETRSPEEAVTMVQIMLRQGNGSSTTFHSIDTKEAMYNMRRLLVRSGQYRDGAEAMYDFCRAIDIVVVLRCDNIGANATGKRYISEICEVPKVSESQATDVVPRVLFKYDPDLGKIIKKNTISKDLKEILMKRKHEPQLMEELLRC